MGEVVRDVTTGVATAAAPYIALAGGVVVVYLFRNQIADWIRGNLVPEALAEAVTTPANELVSTGTTDSLWEWWTNRIKDYGTGKQGPDAPLSGEEGKSVLQVQLERWFGNGGTKKEETMSAEMKAAWLSYDQSRAELWMSQEGVYKPLVTSDPAEFFAHSAAIIAAAAPAKKVITSYEDVKYLDVVPGWDFAAGPDIVSGERGLFLTEYGWNIAKKDVRYAGVGNPEGWMSVRAAGGTGTQDVVWTDPYLSEFLVSAGALTKKESAVSGGA